MASSSKVINVNNSNGLKYFVYDGLNVVMNPSKSTLDTGLAGGRAVDSTTSSPITGSVYIPVPILNVRGMSDANINDALLERLKSCLPKPNENIDLLRAVSARLHSRAASQDKDTRECTLALLRRKKSDGLEILLNLLENVRDHVTATSIAGTIRECIAPKSGPNRVATIRRLIDLNGTQILVKLVVYLHNKEIQSTDMLLQEVLWILGQLSEKDSKFSIKSRLLNAIKVFHFLLRSHYFNHNKMVTPLLMIMKALAKNATTVNVLMRDGVTVTLEKTLTAMGFAPNSKLRLLLNVFSHLTRNHKFCLRMIKIGITTQLLKLFERWERYDGKMRLRICLLTLQTIQHLCCTKPGRRAICNGNGLSLLYKFCQNCPDDIHHDTLLMKTCNIINVCIEKRDLPIGSARHPVPFPLPPHGVYIVPSHSGLDTDDSGEESVDDDGDEDEDIDKLDKDTLLDDQPSQPNFNTSHTTLRDLDDLFMYNSVWSEMMLLKPLQSATIAESQSFVCGNVIRPVKWENRTYRLNRAASFAAQQTGKNYDLDSSVMVGDMNILQNLSRSDSARETYCKIASRVRSVIPFIKVGYPDMVDCLNEETSEPLFVRDRKIYRSKLLHSVERNLCSDLNMCNTVYDIDQYIHEVRPDKLTNDDEDRVGIEEQSGTTLQFESRFESGNLRKAIQIGPREYNLIMTPDVNANSHHNWFYFEVSNMDNVLPYTLNIINCEKPNSQFNFGMRPLLFSVKEAMSGRPKWVRAGTEICYFKNPYICPGKIKKRKSFQTLSFTILFPHTLDVCYIAYHFPYTYSKLLLNLWLWGERIYSGLVHYRVDTLCNTLNNNETPVLTISAPDSPNNKFLDREVIFLTSRVHPGETNSSWVMHGSLNFLLGSTLAADRLRSEFIIKIVPMLNPEGVINGCCRCGLSDEDLNRTWRHPDPVIHPTIYHTKGLIDYSCRVLKKTPYVFCDYHGHSRRKNVFLFGCASHEKWNSQVDSDKVQDSGYYSMTDVRILPSLLSTIAPAFDISQCNFVMEHNKQSTARITIWREFGVSRSYTMESSYCGFDVGIYKGNHMSIYHLEEMGATFCLALVYLSDDQAWPKRNVFVEKIATADPMKDTADPINDDFTESSDSESTDCEIKSAA